MPVLVKAPVSESSELPDITLTVHLLPEVLVPVLNHSHQKPSILCCIASYLVHAEVRLEIHDWRMSFPAAMWAWLHCHVLRLVERGRGSTCI